MNLSYQSLEKINNRWVLKCKLEKEKNFKIKFEVDKQTAYELRPIFSLKPFGNNKEHIYKYAGCSITKNRKEAYHYVNICYSKSRLKKKLKCTERFIKELVWLEEIENEDNLKPYL